MPETRPQYRLEHWVHWTLFAGLSLSGVLLVLGLALELTEGEPRLWQSPHPLRLMIRGALEGNGTDVIDLGLLVLIVTPLLRVLVLAIGWTLEGDLRFALVALTVLALLSVSFMLGVG
jgi:uncharacterized membrane protein